MKKKISIVLIVVVVLAIGFGIYNSRLVTEFNNVAPQLVVCSGIGIFGNEQNVGNSVRIVDILFQNSESYFVDIRDEKYPKIVTIKKTKMLVFDCK